MFILGFCLWVGALAEDDFNVVAAVMSGPYLLCIIAGSTTPFFYHKPSVLVFCIAGFFGLLGVLATIVRLIINLFEDNSWKF